jgi:hypothetical protein
VRDFSLFLHAISKKNALIRIYDTLWTLFLVMMRFLSMAMVVMEKFRIRYLVDAVLGDDEVSVYCDGRDGER